MAVGKRPGARAGVRRALFSIAVFISFAASVLAEDAAMRHGRPAPAMIVDEFPIAVDGAPVLLPVTFGGKSYLFQVDTGSPLVVLDASLKPHLSERLDIAGPRVGARPVEFYHLPRARIGRLSLDVAAPVACMGMESVQFHDGAHILGLIGMSFLEDKVVRIDPDQERLFILKAPGRDAGTRVAMKDVGGCPGIEVQIPGHGAVDVGIDTGCTGFAGLLEHKLFEELRQKQLLTDKGFVETDGVVLGGRKRVGSLSAVNVAEFSCWQPRVAQWSKNDQQPNILGLSWCLRYILTFDFKNGSLYIKKRMGPNLFADHDLSGLVLGFTADGEMVVDDVIANSPAALAGIARGDILLAVDGRKLQGAPPGPVCRLLCEYGRQVHAEVRRDREVLRLALVLPQSEQANAEGQLGAATKRVKRKGDAARFEKRKGDAAR